MQSQTKERKAVADSTFFNIELVTQWADNDKLHWLRHVRPSDGKHAFSNSMSACTLVLRLNPKVETQCIGRCATFAFWQFCPVRINCFPECVPTGVGGTLPATILGPLNDA
jgi:hypothetical protein